MSLRTRLLLSLAVMLSIALLVAGVLLVGLTRASLVDRVDRELQSLSGAGRRGCSGCGGLAAPDSDAGRRLAVLRLDRQGNVVRAYPVGLRRATPIPCPCCPSTPTGIPAEAFGQIAERPRRRRIRRATGC